MPWVVLAAAIALLAVALLAAVGLSVWQRVRALSREVARASEAVGAATAALAEVQGATRRTGPVHLPGVGSSASL